MAYFLGENILYNSNFSNFKSKVIFEDFFLGFKIGNTKVVDKISLKKISDDL